MSETQSLSFPSSLTKFSSASLKELIHLSAPITFILFSGSLMGFCDRLFLAHDSLVSLEGCVNASYLAQLFQVSLSFCTSSAQIFVGQCMGAKIFNRVGTYVWQMIWFSLLTMLITYPTSFFVASLFFANTSVKEAGAAYFQWVMPFNFLFPLGAALTAFYFGQGKMRFIMWCTFFANVLNVILDAVLIFGIDGWLPRLGISGAALATGVSQGFFCVLLFLDFINRKNREIFGTGRFHLQWNVLQKCIRLGVPRCISKLTMNCAWIACVHLMTLKGGDYLLTVTLGSSLSLLFTYINDGMGQGITTIASYLIGKGDHKQLRRLLKTSFIFLALSSMCVFIPCVLMPRPLLLFFFMESPTEQQMAMLTRCCLWLWMYFVAYGIAYIPFGFLTALGDTFFKMLYDVFSTWMLNYLAVFLIIGIWGFSAESLYLILALKILASGLIYFWRLRTLQWRSLVFQQAS